MKIIPAQYKSKRSVMVTVTGDFYDNFSEEFKYEDVGEADQRFQKLLSKILVNVKQHEDPRDLTDLRSLDECKGFHNPKLIDTRGNVVGKLLPDGLLIYPQGEVIGLLNTDATLVTPDGEKLPFGVLSIVDENGLIVGVVRKSGKIKSLHNADRTVIGYLRSNGLIVTTQGAPIGQISKNGQIHGKIGEEMGFFTDDWQIVGLDGVPFAYVSSDGKIFRYEKIQMRISMPHRRKIDVVETKEEMGEVEHHLEELDLDSDLVPEDKTFDDLESFRMVEFLDALKEDLTADLTVSANLAGKDAKTVS